MLRTVGHVLNSTQLRLWQMVLASIVTAAFSVGYSEWSSARKLDQSERSEEIIQFFNATNKFDTLAQVYVGSVLDSQHVNRAAREELLANLQEQNSLLQIAKVYLPKNKAFLAKNYQTELVGLANDVGEIEDLAEMGSFWTQMSDTMVARRALVDALREETGRKVDA